MKMQLLFFRRERIFLKKEVWLWAHISISPTCFRSGFREKNALGNQNKVKGESNHAHVLVRVLIRESV